ncbi:F-box protein skip23 [Thalictrum thalictroides]|uniref:F-box protein skip23 n=1 Tax=Thalictrum thalictroides TaxID=46969 RepID=A0A7J6X911_THATH|nr:F-box protein skip23 [Thalictrum thalictroides]
MNQSTVNCWSDLPSELLDLIAQNLRNYVDYVRLRAVCPSWHSNLPKKPNHLLTQLPWLLLPHYDNNIISETHCSFFNLADNQTYRLELPEVLGNGKVCWGSPHGWLVILNQEGPLLSLLNPLTREEIRLPSLFFFPETILRDDLAGIVIPWDSIGYLRNSKIVKALLFGNPSETTDYVVIVIMTGGPCSLAFFRAGAVAWTLFMDTRKISFLDVVLFRGQFYAVDYAAHVYICYLGVSPNIVQIANPAETYADAEPEAKYLVESVNELLLVYRYQFHIWATRSNSTYYFTVHKLELSESKWTVVDDLEEQVLFLGTHCSFSLSAGSYPCCRGNSVYYTDEHWDPSGTPSLSKGSCNCVRGYDLGVFSLYDGDVELPPSYPLPSSCSIKCIVPPPVWVTLAP